MYSLDFHSSINTRLFYSNFFHSNFLFSPDSIFHCRSIFFLFSPLPHLLPLSTLFLQCPYSKMMELFLWKDIKFKLCFFVYLSHYSICLYILPKSGHADIASGLRKSSAILSLRKSFEYWAHAYVFRRDACVRYWSSYWWKWFEWHRFLVSDFI